MISVHFSFYEDLEKDGWRVRTGGKDRLECGTTLSVGDERGPREEECLLTTVISTDLLEQNDI